MFAEDSGFDIPSNFGVGLAWKATSVLTLAADVDAAAKAVEDSGGGIVKGPYDDAHERRAVVYDNKGNGLVFYKPLAR